MCGIAILRLRSGPDARRALRCRGPLSGAAGRCAGRTNCDERLRVADIPLAAARRGRRALTRTSRVRCGSSTHCAKTHGIDCGFVKAGERLTTDQRRLARRLGLEPRVVGNRLYARARPSCAVRVLPGTADAVALRRALAGPALEAMACGTPAVTSDCPAFRETASPAALASARCGYARARGRGGAAPAGRFGPSDATQTRGLELVQRFRWDRTARELADIYGDGRGNRMSTPPGPARYVSRLHAGGG